MDAQQTEYYTIDDKIKKVVKYINTTLDSSNFVSKESFRDEAIVKKIQMYRRVIKRSEMSINPELENAITHLFQVIKDEKEPRLPWGDMKPYNTNSQDIQKIIYKSKIENILINN